MGKHIAWIDDAKTLTMLLVIVGHCTYVNLVTPYGGISYFENIPQTDYSFMWNFFSMMVCFIYKFHMPLFMFLSGACFSLTINRVPCINVLIKTKMKRLLIPFIYTALFVSIPLKFMYGYYMHSTNILKDIIYGQIFLMGNSHLWFVFSLFWIFLMYYLLYKIRLTSRWYFLPLLVLLSLMAERINNRGIEFMGIVAAMKYLLYFSIGFRYLCRINSLKWGGLIIIFHSLFYIGLFLFLWFWGDYFKFLNSVFTILMGIYGSFIVIQIAKYLRGFPTLTNNKVYQIFSRNSYELYLFSDPFNYMLLYLMNKFMGNYITDNLGSLYSFLVRFLGTIILAFAVIWIKKKFIIDLYRGYSKS